MDGLRLALLIAGVVLIGGIYVFGRLSRRGGGGRGRSARKPRGGIEGSESASQEWSREVPSEAPESTAHRLRHGTGRPGATTGELHREPGGEDSESAVWEPRREAEASEQPVSFAPDFDTGSADPDTATQESYRGPGGQDSESGAREPRREAEVSEPASRETGAGGEDSQTTVRKPYPGPGGEGSESAVWEPRGEAEVEDSDSIPRKPYPGPGGEGSESAVWEPRGEAEVEDSDSIPREPYPGPGGEGSESAVREPRGEAEASEPVSWEARDDTGGEDRDTTARKSRHGPDDEDPEGGARERRPAFDPRSVDGGYDIGALGGMFAPRRKTSDEELSVDVSILSGMRASYEGTVDDSVPPAPGEGDGQPSLDASRPIVFLTLIAKRGRLPGHAILDAFDAEDFRPGPMRIYHYEGHSEPGAPAAFGVANLVEPGVLEPDSLPGIETPGLVMFMGVAADVAGASRTLEAMIAAGRRLAHRLDATLCDETRSTLTAQAENHLRERVADIARRGRSGG